MAAAHRTTRVRSAPSVSSLWNGGCHVGALLSQAADGRPDHGLLARTGDRALRHGPVQAGLLDPQHPSARPHLDGVREVRGSPQCQPDRTGGSARRRDRNFARGTVRHFFSLAISKSEYHRTKSSWADPFAAQVPGFFEYLREERGLRSSSIHHYQHYLRRFERYLDQAECRDLGALALPVVTGFVTTTAQEFGSRAMVCLASTLRVFLRYANREGVLRRDLSKLIEVPQHYRLADIPRS